MKGLVRTAFRGADLIVVAAAMPSALSGAYLALLTALARPKRALVGDRSVRFAVVIPAHNEALGIAETVASVLALDYLHRAKNPLGTELAAKVRWAVANELGCVYAVRYAESDLRRIGTSDAELADLKKGEVNPTDRMVLKFARKLTCRLRPGALVPLAYTR